MAIEHETEHADDRSGLPRATARERATGPPGRSRPRRPRHRPVTTWVAPRAGAMILAAGFGRRLWPLTTTRAKAVVPFLNRPLLDYTLDWLRRAGVDRVVINLHHEAETIRDRYRDEWDGMRVGYSVEETLLGTAGGPRAALERLADPVVIVNGDIVTTMALGRLIDRHRRRSAVATLALHAGPLARHHPALPIDDDGRVLGFEGDVLEREVAEPGSRHACFAGVHVVDGRGLEVLPEGRPTHMIDHLYRHLVDAGLLEAMVLPGAWYEVGTPDRYRQAQLLALRREELPLAFRGYQRDTRSGWLTARVVVGRAALEPPYLLADGTRIADGARVAGAVAGRRVQIGPGAEVVDSVLLDGAWIGAGARVESSVVAQESHVPPGAEAVSGVWIGDAPWSGKER